MFLQGGIMVLSGEHGAFMGIVVRLWTYWYFGVFRGI